MQREVEAEAAHQGPLVGMAAAFQALDVHQPVCNAKRQPGGRQPYGRRAHDGAAPDNHAPGVQCPGIACSTERAVSQASTSGCAPIWHSRCGILASVSRKRVGRSLSRAVDAAVSSAMAPTHAAQPQAPRASRIAVTQLTCSHRALSRPLQSPCLSGEVATGAAPSSARGS